MGGGQGGGLIQLNISRALHLDGYLYARGGEPSNQTGGGGSGGSIYIHAVNFSGHGNISTEGGQAVHYGGAGGRIGVKVLWLREFSGRYIAFGGLAEECGAAGTTYYTDSRKGLTHREPENTTDGIVFKDGFRKLSIDNDNRNHEIATVIESESGTVFEFDEVDAKNHVVLQMLGPTDTMIVHKFTGDRTGLFHLQTGQKLYVEYIASQIGYTIAPVSYLIEPGAELISPSTMVMLGTRTTVQGILTNIHNLSIAEGAETVFHSTAQTALLENDHYVHQTDPGNVTFASLTIQRGSVLELRHIDQPLTLHVDTLRLKYQGLLNMNRGYIDSDTSVVESEGLMQLSYTGHGPETGTGAGFTDPLGWGTGAAHGGHGGAPRPLQGGKGSPIITYEVCNMHHFPNREAAFYACFP